jgi:hypothetical protein
VTASINIWAPSCKIICVVVPTSIQHLYAHFEGGRLILYKLVSLRLTLLQAYHVCSSLLVRKIESPELSMDPNVTSHI